MRWRSGTCVTHDIKAKDHDHVAADCFRKTKLGCPLALQNRLVMAPLTRNRATGNVPNELMAEYYAQRASAGLIITEGTSPSPNGLGYPRIPGIFSAAQVAGWKRVTAAVTRRARRCSCSSCTAGASPIRSTCRRARACWGRRRCGRRRDVHRRRGDEAERDPAGDDRGGHQGRHRGICAGREERRGGGIRRRRAARRRTAICSSSSSARTRTSAPMATAARSRTARASCSKSPMRRSRPSARTRSASACRRSACSTTCRIYPAMEADYTYLAQQLNARGLVYIHLVDHSPMGAPPVPDSIKATFRSVFKRRADPVRRLRRRARRKRSRPRANAIWSRSGGRSSPTRIWSRAGRRARR